ncbi:hypothetical protein BH23VER1_BH23VER1_05730 [soil metagenome]
MAATDAPLTVSRLLLLEFRQSVRFQVRRNRLDKTKGFPMSQGDRMLRAIQSDVAVGALAPRSADWPVVYEIAERLSATHTATGGHRLADILHVATALYFGATEFLTFDANQKVLAEAEGMRVTL